MDKKNKGETELVESSAKEHDVSCHAMDDTRTVLMGQDAHS